MPSNKVRGHRLTAAIDYMREHHKGQVRKVSQTPYDLHPLGVLELMEESPFFFPERDKIMALLHDIKEDSPDFSWDDLVTQWGAWVAGGVALLSKGKLGEKSPSTYFTMLRMVHPTIIGIKLIDRIYNTSDYNAIKSVKWLRKYREETIEHVLPLIQIMVASGANVGDGYYELGVWIEDKLQANLHGMHARILELEGERGRQQQELR